MFASAKIVSQSDVHPRASQIQERLQAALQQKGNGDVKPATNDGTSEGAKDGAGTAQEGDAQESEGDRANGKTELEQGNGTQAGGEVENGATGDPMESESGETSL